MSGVDLQHPQFCHLFGVDQRKETVRAAIRDTKRIIAMLSRRESALLSQCDRSFATVPSGMSPRSADVVTSAAETAWQKVVKEREALEARLEDLALEAGFDTF